MVIQTYKTYKVWILLNPSMCYSGCFWDTKRYSLFSLSFLTEFFSKWFCCSSSIAFSPFYRVNLGSRLTIDSPVLLPVYQSLFCAHRPEGWAFRCFSFFLPFDVVSSKAHGWLFYSEVCLFLMSRSLWFNFWSSFPFVIFPEWAESNSVGLKVFLLLLPFL